MKITMTEQEVLDIVRKNPNILKDVVSTRDAEIEIVGGNKVPSNSSTTPNFENLNWVLTHRKDFLIEAIAYFPNTDINRAKEIVRCVSNNTFNYMLVHCDINLNTFWKIVNNIYNDHNQKVPYPNNKNDIDPEWEAKCFRQFKEIYKKFGCDAVVEICVQVNSDLVPCVFKTISEFRNRLSRDNRVGYDNFLCAIERYHEDNIQKFNNITLEKIEEEEAKNEKLTKSEKMKNLLTFLKKFRYNEAVDKIRKEFDMTRREARSAVTALRIAENESFTAIEQTICETIIFYPNQNNGTTKPFWDFINSYA